MIIPTNEMIAALSAYFLARGSTLDPVTQIPVGSVPLNRLSAEVATAAALSAAIYPLQQEIAQAEAQAGNAQGTSNSNAASILSLAATNATQSSQIAAQIAALNASLSSALSQITALENRFATTADLVMSLEDGASAGTYTVTVVGGVITTIVAVP